MGGCGAQGARHNTFATSLGRHTHTHTRVVRVILCDWGWQMGGWRSRLDTRTCDGFLHGVRPCKTAPLGRRPAPVNRSNCAPCGTIRHARTVARQGVGVLRCECDSPPLPRRAQAQRAFASHDTTPHLPTATPTFSKPVPPPDTSTTSSFVSMLASAASTAAVGAYVGSIFIVVATLIIATLCLPHPVAVAWLALMVRRERGRMYVSFFLREREREHDPTPPPHTLRPPRSASRSPTPAPSPPVSPALPWRPLLTTFL